MDASAIAATLDETIRSLKFLQYDVDDDNFDWVAYEDIIQDLEQLSDDIQAEEAERLDHIGCGGLAFCLYCGLRFVHGLEHPCSDIKFRKDRLDATQR